jgi:23S rRNA (uracil1939-C5)-methyltransferase
MKEEILRDCLSRIGKIETGLLPAIVGRDFNYRHRGQFKVSRDGRIGFYREASRDVIDIEECPLMISGVNEALGRARAAGVLESKSAGAHEVIKELHITQGAQGGDLTALVRGRGFDGALAEHFAAIGFTGVAFEDESYRGCGYVSLDLSGLKYTVSPWSFFQSNWGLNNEVVGVLLEGLRPLEGKRALDMYAGAGNFSLPISREAAEVVAVEDNPHAVKDGQRNLSLNGIKNVKPIKAHIEKAKLAGKFDVAVLDPPRPGLTAEAMRTVLDIAPERIAYVSCNPSTLARDIGKMRDKYDLASVRLIDLFPNTYHIEAIALLDRKGA